jgi:hypothetical protein
VCEAGGARYAGNACYSGLSLSLSLSSSIHSASLTVERSSSLCEFHSSLFARSFESFPELSSLFTSTSANHPLPRDRRRRRTRAAQIILDAYGKLASKRLIDDVPMLLTAALITPLAARLRQATAGPTDEDLRSLLAETDAVMAGRRRAAAQLLAMEAAEAAFEAVARRRLD